MTPFVDLALARRLEASDTQTGMEYVSAFARRHPSVGAVVEEIAGGAALFAGVGSPITQAVGLGLSGPVSSADLDRLDGFYRDRRAAAQIVLCPFADSSFVAALGRRGYPLAEFENVLLRPIAPGERIPEPPQGIEVRAVGREGAATWTHVVARGFFETEDPSPEILSMIAGLFEAGSNQAFIAWIDGEPVGGGGLKIRDGLASLMGSSTLPAFRNRGIQGALHRVRLARAVAAGCDLATVGTKGGSVSQRNAERVGFRVAYTRAVLRREWE